MRDFLFIFAVIFPVSLWGSPDASALRVDFVQKGTLVEIKITNTSQEEIVVYGVYQRGCVDVEYYYPSVKVRNTNKQIVSKAFVEGLYYWNPIMLLSEICVLKAPPPMAIKPQETIVRVEDLTKLTWGSSEYFTFNPERDSVLLNLQFYMTEDQSDEIEFESDWMTLVGDEAVADE